MAVPNYRPVFKVPYNPVQGLASLLQGYNVGAQQKFQNQNADRNAPVGANEAARYGMEQKAKIQALMEAMNPGAGVQGLISSFPSTPQAVATPVSAQPANTNIAPAVSAPPIAQPTPQTPTAVNKAGAIFGSARSQLKAMYTAAQAKGAVSFDDATNTFYDAKGNPVE